MQQNSSRARSLEYHTPEARLREPYVPVTRMQLQIGLAIASLLLTVVSICVVYRDANTEPYYVFRRSDVLIQVGVATALIILWLVLLPLVLLLAGTRKVSAAWFALLIWMPICIFYLSFSPVGYLSDLQKNVIAPEMQMP